MVAFVVGNPLDGLYISAVTLEELRFGVERAAMIPARRFILITSAVKSFAPADEADPAVRSMNMLCTSIEHPQNGMTMDHHVEQWRRRGHVVKVMPVERLASYLRFDPSIDFALVDAIVCWAASGFVAFNGAEVEPLFPLGTALRLASELRELPESCAMHDGRKWKRLPFVIFAGAAENPPPYFLELPENVAVLDPICNRSPDYALARIRDCIDSYYDRVLEDYRTAGLLLRFDKGHVQIGPALTPRDPDAEGAYYLGHADRREHRGWVTVRRDREGLSEDVETFRCLLERNASETEMHRFFEQHPAVLMEATECIPLSHRPTFANPKRATPDCALSPILGPTAENNSIGLLELKGPAEKLLTKDHMQVFQLRFIVPWIRFGAMIAICQIPAIVRQSGAHLDISPAVLDWRF